jgi:hypothetical protein
MQQLMKAFYNDQERVKFDDEVVEAENLTVQNNNILIYYQKNRAQMNVSAPREFIDKRITFKHNDKIYVFHSSVPDDMKDLDHNNVRTYCIMGYEVFEK